MEIPHLQGRVSKSWAGVGFTHHLHSPPDRPLDRELGPQAGTGCLEQVQTVERRDIERSKQAAFSWVTLSGHTIGSRVSLSLSPANMKSAPSQHLGGLHSRPKDC